MGDKYVDEQNRHSRLGRQSENRGLVKILGLPKLSKSLSETDCRMDRKNKARTVVVRRKSTGGKPIYGREGDFHRYFDFSPDDAARLSAM